MAVRFNDNQPFDYQVHRTTSIHRNATRVSTMPRNMDEQTAFRADSHDNAGRDPLERHAAAIVRHMMQSDDNLIEDSPESEELRKQTLRDLPQCLTVKRNIKKQLLKTVSQKSKRRRPISCFKHMKYRLSMSLTKANVSFKNFLFGFELWYGTLKTIEGRFGSGVATYFKFLRWLFIMNCFVIVPAVAFIVVPQMVYTGYDGRNEDNDAIDASVVLNESSSFEALSIDDTDVPFVFSNIFTGEGYFTNTLLYYGHYTNSTMNTINNVKYSMPYAYFFTMLFIYLTAFIILSISVAKSYRCNFIETSGGLKNVYAHKIFCGWDFSIATAEGSALKSHALFNELKELLSDLDSHKNLSCLQKFWTVTIQIIFNIVYVIVLSGTGYLMWYLLEKNKSFLDEAEEIEDSWRIIVTAVVVNAIMALFPLFFSAVVRYEDYKTPRTALNITLLRTFLLELIIVCILVSFWLSRTDMQCWETSLGQEIYRLILFDFIFSIILAIFVELVRVVVYKYLWRGIGVSEFDIARHTLQIIYNQTLFWLGLYFSPLLAIVVAIKLACTWYVRSVSALHFCKPSRRSWRAAQTQTLFLVLTFVALLLIASILGYVIMQVPTSNCGPFRQYPFMYNMIIRDVFSLEQSNTFWKIIRFVTKPGVIAGILIVMSVKVYYLRAKAQAQKGVVSILREMLIMEAKDKDFVLMQITDVTRGRWRYNSVTSRMEFKNPYTAEPDLSDGDNMMLRNRRFQSDLSGSNPGSSSGIVTTDVDLH